MLSSGTILQTRYQIIHHLGGGGMSDVYLASDQRLGNNHVVIKENKSSDAQLFQREANLLASLNHPNLPRVTDHFVEKNNIQYLVIDYVQGQNLAEIVSHNGPVSEAKALGWMKQIFDAVKYLHSNRVIHRDIKPQNIIITRQFKAVLVDFGISKIIGSSNKTHSAAHGIGSPGYAPPEQYSGGTDERADVYALGATLYFALTSNDPIPANERAFGTPLMAIRASNRKVSMHTEATVLKAMEIQGARRYQNIAAFEDELYARSASATRPIATIHQPAPFQSGARTLQTHKRESPFKWLVIGFATMFALAVLGAVVLFAVLFSQGGARFSSPNAVSLQIRTNTSELSATQEPRATRLPSATNVPTEKPTLSKPTRAVLTNTPFYIVVTSIPTATRRVPTATRRPNTAPAPSASGHSRNNPASLGQTVTWTNQKGDKQFNVTVLEVHRGEEAWRRIQAANRFNKPSPPRAEYILLRVRAEFVKGDPIKEVILSESNMAVVTSDGRIIESFEGETVVPPEPMFLTKVFPGASFDGWAAFTIPLGDPTPLLLYRGDDYASTRGVWFRLY